MSDTAVELGRLISERFERAVPGDPDTDLVADLGLDSLQQLELVVALENHFEIVLEPEEGESIRTLGDVARWVDRAREGRAS